MNIHNPIRIVITGPESTGKTQLAKDLSSFYKTIWIPEFAREYVENLQKEYSYNDVENIAKQQIEQYKTKNRFNDYVFFDTWLVITKVWFKEVYRSYPCWLDEAIKKYPVDLYLICDTDIAWEEDSVRENGDNRNYLKSAYIKEINETGVPYQLISGQGDDRLMSAVNAIKSFNS